MRPIRHAFGVLVASPARKAMTAAVMSLVAAVLLPFAYRLWGVALITDAYFGRSFSFLNRIAALRQDHSLEEFYAAAESVLSEVVFALVATSLVLFAFTLYTWLTSTRRDKHRRYVDRFDMVVFVTGLLVSVSMVLWFDDLYHESDIETFLEWRDSLSRSLTNIYVGCGDCNYPIVGTVLSAGTLHALSSVLPTLDTEALIQSFRYLLALVDAANVVLVYLVLKTSRVPRSLFWAGLIGLLPSSWVGAALFGQIDGFTQFFLLAFLLLQVTFMANRAKEGSAGATPNSLIWYVVGSSLLLVCLLLSKQLAIFSVPVLAGMVVGTLYLTAGNRFLPLTGSVIGLVAIGVLLPDIFLELETGYFSHLQYILIGGGSEHINRIARNGFNIWVLLGWEMSSSSTEPFFGVLTPRDTGASLFLIYEAFLFGSALRWLRRKQHTPLTGASNRDLFLVFVFLLALTNLSFNVLLTGTQARYLFHFYPFALITVLFLRRITGESSRWMLAAILTGAVFYGRFVWGILQPDAVVIPAELAAVFHLCLFVFLTVTFVRYHRSSVKNLAGAVRGT